MSDSEAESHSTPSLFQIWCDKTSGQHQGHAFEVLTEKPNVRESILQKIVSVIHQNYDSPERFLARAQRLGFDQAVRVIHERLPTIATARSGDLGEILATEYANSVMGFLIPINRLQWKDGRNLPLRGDDLIGVKLDKTGNLSSLLKGESKSRIALHTDAIDEAVVKLREYEGQPAPHTLFFIVDRLHELGKSSLAEQLEDFALVGRPLPVTHLVFTLSGNSPTDLFTTALSAEYIPSIRRQLVGVVVEEHGAFVASVYELAGA